MVLYKEFKLKDLYADIKRGKRIVKIDRIQGVVPLVTAGEENYGISEYIKEHSTMGERNSVTIDMFGNVFYREEEFYMDDNIINLKNTRFSRYHNLYIVSALRYLTQIYSYAKQFRMKSLEDTYIQLPVKNLEDDEPDWEYMEEYIKQKELACIGKLNLEFEQKKEQLIELIGEESEYINIKELPTSKFKVGDLFNIYTGKDLILGKLEKGNIPVISHSADNNGISHRSGKIETRPLYDKDRVISLADRGTFKAYVQQEDFYVGTRVKALEVKDDFQVSKEVLQYLATSINKLSELFDYSMNATGKIPELEIVLPNNPEVSEIVPDWETMEKYIARIELQLLNRVINTLNT